MIRCGRLAIQTRNMSLILTQSCSERQAELSFST